jgi:hypothetical protein
MSLAVTAVSHASTAQITAGGVVVSAQSNEDNDFTIAYDSTSDSIQIFDEGWVTGSDGAASVEIQAGSGCSQAATDEVDCPKTSITSPTQSVNLGDGDSNSIFYAQTTADVMKGLTVNVEGGDGVDVVSDSPGNDNVNGGAGSDILDAGGGTDTLNGGDGADTLIDDGGFGGTPDTPATPDHLNGDSGDDDIQATSQADGADFYDGGSGLEVDGDSISYSDRFFNALRIDLTGATTSGDSGESDALANFENASAGATGTIIGTDGPNRIFGSGQQDTITGGGGDDDINGGSGNDNIDAGAGNDSIDGGNNNDTIHGGGGDDTIDGGDGADSVFGDAGNDDLFMEDTVVDTAIDCGTDTDTAELDDFDPAPSGCETVFRPSGTTGGGGGTGGGGDTGGTGGTGGTVGTVGTGATGGSTNPPANNTPPPIVFTNGAFVSSLQQSLKANKVVGSATIASDGSKLLVEVFNGKPSKKTRVGKASKTGLKKGSTSFAVTLSKKASKAALKKKKKGLKMTVRVTITPPSGKAFVKTFKVTVKKGKPSACFRAARVPAHIAC